MSETLRSTKAFFGGRRKDKRGQAAAGEVVFFDILTRGVYIQTVALQGLKWFTLVLIIRRQVRPNLVADTDGFSVYETLNVVGFEHHRINHGDTLASGSGPDINGIETSGIRSSGTSSATMGSR